MGEKEPDWLDIPRSLIRTATAYLEKHGYADNDVYELAHPVPIKSPENPNQNALITFMHLDKINQQPKAEIVATAHVLYLARLVLRAWESGEQDIATELMYDLGHQKAVANTFVMSPGLPAQAAFGKNKYLMLAVAGKDKFTADVKTDVHLHKQRDLRSAKNKRGIFERNELICKIGQQYIDEKEQAHKITLLVVTHFTKNKLWEKFPPGTPLTEKHIRQILREGGVIPQARKKKTT